MNRGRIATSVGFLLVLAAATAYASDELLPSPLEAFATQKDAKIIHSTVIGKLQSEDSRATLYAITVENKDSSPQIMRGVRIELEHLKSNPSCNLKYAAWSEVCKREHAALYIEESRIDETAKHLLRGVAELRPMEFISEWRSGTSSVEVHGLIIGGFSFDDRTGKDLAALLDRASEALATQ